MLLVQLSSGERQPNTHQRLSVEYARQRTAHNPLHCQSQPWHQTGCRKQWIVPEVCVQKHILLVRYRCTGHILQSFFVPHMKPDNLAAVCSAPTRPYKKLQPNLQSGSQLTLAGDGGGARNIMHSTIGHLDPTPNGHRPAVCQSFPSFGVCPSMRKLIALEVTLNGPKCPESIWLSQNTNFARMVGSHLAPVNVCLASAILRSCLWKSLANSLPHNNISYNTICYTLCRTPNFLLIS